MKSSKNNIDIKDSIDTNYILERGRSVDQDVHKWFTEKKWVWVPHQTESFVAGCILSENNGIVEVESNGSIKKFRSNEVMKMNPPKFDMVEDLAALSHLNEPSVLYNLKKRYENGYIYTYSGLFLLAINPYRNLKIYDDEYIRKYTMNKKYDLNPHIFAVANEAYNLMLSNRENQSILITGESGAGKTENTKKVIQFLASVAGCKSETDSVDKQIIISNPILEAFGNAKTIKNDNSSRFGKFIQIKFSGGNICGASIEKYLLEKSRVTRQNKDERNYHIFYQLIKGADVELRRELFLENDINKYKYTRFSAHSIEGVDDVYEFKCLRESMKALRIPQDKEISFYKIVSAILHLGNIEFRTVKDQTEISNMEEADKVCKLLKISLADFIKYLLHPVIKAGNEIVSQNRSIEQAYRIVDALAKILYDKMFDAVIENLNRCLGAINYSSFIGVLDIAGFEIFKENSFEQLCINYTNEKLQQFFNHHMFILEQEIYKQENIEWNFIDFGLDLQPTIDLIEKNNPIGILSFLDEECVMPMATDQTFLEKLSSNIKNDKFETIKFKSGFKLSHYAGSVEYDVKDWLVKNKDPNSEGLNSLINRSQDENISKLSFLESENIKKGYFRTVSQKHKEQLISLMRNLSTTNPHFVRCIIPNLQKTGEYLENSLILEQLKCNGVLEGIRISRQGFPSRMKYKEFVERYKILLLDFKKAHDSDFISQAFSQLENSTMIDFKEISSLILDNIRVNPSQFRLGKTKIFFRQSILADIEDLRDIKIAFVMREIQALTRMRIAKRQYNIDDQRRKAMGLIQRNAKICVDLQKWSWWRLYLKVKPLLEVNKRDNLIQEKDNTILQISDKVKAQNKTIEDLSDKLKELTRHRDQLIKNIESEKAFSNEKDDTLMALREKNNQLNQDLNKKKEEYLEMQDYLEKTFESLKLESTKAETLTKQLKEKKDKLESKISELEDSLAEKEKQINETKINILNSQSENKAHLENLIKTSEAEIVALKKKIKQKDALLANYVSELNKSVENNKDLEDSVNVLKESIEKITKEKDGLEQEIKRIKEAFQEEKTQHTLALKKIEGEFSDLNIENEKLESEMTKMRKMCDEKDALINRVSKDIEFKNVTIDNLKKTVDSLHEQLAEYEKKDREDRENKLYLNSSHEALLEKIKNYEKKIKNLGDKCLYFENLNNQISLEKEELHKENLNLLQSKLDDIFKRETEFNVQKKSLQKEIQLLENENKILKRDNEELRMLSESSDESISTTEKLYMLLEQEKKNKKQIEQTVIQYENSNLVLKNEVEELKEKCDALQKETEDLGLELKFAKSKKTQSSEACKEFDRVFDDINRAIDGFNTIYFRILDDNKVKIAELIKENSSKDVNLKELASKIIESESIVDDLRSEIQNLRDKNISLEKKINISGNDYDALNVKFVCMEQSLLEKEMEIAEYKKTIQNYQNVVDELQSKRSDEILAFKSIEEELNNKLNQLKNDLENALQSYYSNESKEKKKYEDKINTIYELEKRKRSLLESDNSRLAKENQDFEKKVFDLHNDLISVTNKLENVEFEFNLKNEKEKQYVFELEKLKKSLNDVEEKGKITSAANKLVGNAEEKFVYVIDKDKLQAMERKRLILEKEFNKNQEVINNLCREKDKLASEKAELKKEISSLKTQLFDLKRSNNTQSVVLNQLERELADEKDLLSFLKPFSISKKTSKK